MGIEIFMREGQMTRADEAYEVYVLRCHALGVKAPMSRAEYEKFIHNLPTPTPNNTDAILRNNNQRKDK